MYTVGCDVSKATLDAAARPDEAAGVSLSTTNNLKGYSRLLRWMCDRYQCEPQQLRLVMEATGVYHLPLAGFMHAHGVNVVVTEPLRATEFARSRGLMHKTDKLDAAALQVYGVQLEQPRHFEPDTPEIQALKAYLQRVWQLDRDLTRERNRLEKCPFIPGSAGLGRSIKRQIRQLEQEKQRVLRQIDTLISSDTELQRICDLVATIKGIGKLTAQRLLPLLYRERFVDARQFAAFLGLTPVRRQSGTSLNSRGRLSGRGNRHLRAALYMPALAAIRHDPTMRAFYDRLCSRGKQPKQAITAVMRKLTHIAWGVVHNNTPYDPQWAG